MRNIAMDGGPPIKRLDVSAYTVPTDRSESDGTADWDSTTVVFAQITAGGKTGLGYTYADASAAKLLNGRLRRAVEGQDAFAIPAIWQSMLRAVRNTGRSGIASEAISAVDVALWDLKARLLGVSLVDLLGASRNSVPVYGSGGFTSYTIDELQNQLAGWVESGITMVKMKVGTHPDDDIERVDAARAAIGLRAKLFVDANGAYSRKEALAYADAFSHVGVTWFEEPVSSDDLEGLRLIRDRAPAGMDIAAGEYGYEPVYFQRMLRSGAVDVLQADATRCGGITGFLLADALCVAASMPLSAHTAPSIHAHVCCASQQCVHVEYFYDHVRIESMLFDGALEPVDGTLHPDQSRPGLGIELKKADAERLQRAA